MHRSCWNAILLASALSSPWVLACNGGSGGNDPSTGTDTGVEAIGDVPQAVDNLSDASGDTVPACLDQCSQEGITTCLSEGVSTCADVDSDGCLEWSLPVACPPGKTCQDGQCTASCPAAPCSLIGAHRCQPGSTRTIEECNDFDRDGCLEWGNPVDCEGGLVCAGGFCASSCSNGCTTIGARKCDLNRVVVCGDYNSDGCLEWGDASDCSPQVCANGYCAAACQNECTTPEARSCDGNGFKVCGNFDGDPCLEWGTVQSCGPGQTCSAGYCGDNCQDECTVAHARRCDESLSVVTCGDFDDDPCLEWSSPVPCEEGLVCAGGFCENRCQSQCTVAKARQCNEAGLVVVCDDYNGDGCLEWGSGIACESPLVCDQGNCRLACTDECAVKFGRRCTPGMTNRFEVCDEYDGDGCLEWGTPQACEGSLVCSGSGDCTVSCQSECAVADARKCEGEAVRQCDDYNGDSCLEWGTAVPCEIWERCQDGRCLQKDPPAQVVIAEVLFDSTGFPDLDTFVELAGPAGTDLTGWVLAGVNGADGKDYSSARFVLAGQIPSDGRFVLAHPDANPQIRAETDQWMKASDDIQNGPDSLQLRYGTRVVDAVGYGTFPNPAYFAGEGNPAPRPPENQSLGRDAQDTDTDDNARDFVIHSRPTPGARNVTVNEPPSASLSCTGSVVAGQPATLDASASFDSDGTIVTYAFQFGDGESISGASAIVTHAYASPGSRTVTVTVTDNGGATAQATCQVVVTDDKAPEAVIIRPADDTQVTQGLTVNVLADATPAPGRTIASVLLLVDGTPWGTPDDAPPYEFTYTVPQSQPKDSTVVLVAQAQDSQGSAGVSAPVRLRVRNDPPVPRFTAVVTGALEVTVDASASTDTETPSADLEVRWDFQNDGTWDTSWSAGKVATFTYPSDGTYTVRMEVRDGIGQVASLTREVTLSSIQYVSGTVTTTTWTGTIVITGDVVVPAGNTLTVAEGTSVLFVHIDQNSDGVGDYDIVVNGTLDVNGTQAKPVLFTSYGSDHRHPKAWNMLRLAGAGSTLDWAVIEYADTGLDIRNDARIEDTVVRLCHRGISVSASGSTTPWTRTTLTRNADNGITLSSGTVEATSLTLSENGGRGAYVTGGTLNLSGSVVTAGGMAGLEWFGGGGGLVTRNVISGNALEGVRVTTNGSSDPTPVIQFNNILGNALLRGRVAGSPGISVSTTAGDYGTFSSAPWSTPGGEEIQFVLVSYTENDSSSNYVSGSVKKNDQNGATLWTSGSATTTWADLRGQGASRIVATVADYQSSSYYGALTVQRALWEQAGAVREGSFATRAETIDARHNYWGAFPRVLDVLTLGTPTSVNLEGFTGVPFDATWTKGPYLGGETLTTAQSWSGDVFVTGNLVVQGVPVTLAAGTRVLFAPVDQDGNGVGDYTLRMTNCTLNVQGQNGNPVTFSSAGGDVRKAYQETRLDGTGTSTIAWAVFENGSTGLRLETGSHTLADVTLRNNFQQGLRVRSNGASDQATLTRVEATGNNRGIVVESARNVSLAQANLHHNSSDGLSVTGSTSIISVSRSTFAHNGGSGLYLATGTATAIEDSTFSNNTQHGLYLQGATAPIDYCNVQYNGVGVRAEGGAAGSLRHSNVKYNDDEGILLVSGGTANPTLAVNDCNVFGNAVRRAGIVATSPLSVTTTAGDYGTFTSAPWSTPQGETVLAVRLQYSENDSSSNYVSGHLKQDDGNGVTIFSAASAAGPLVTWIETSGATRLVVQVADYQSSSYHGSMSVSGLYYRAANEPTVVRSTELTAITATGTVNCRSNYWGAFPDPTPRFSLVRSDAIDFQGFVGSAIPGLGPR